MLDQRHIEITAVLRGKVIDPGHAEYDNARKIYNGMIDRRPRMIIGCADVADVIAAVKYARETGTLISVRGGGHNGAGLCLCDDAICADLSGMKWVRVDPKKRTVEVGPGCTWGDVDHATQPFGLAVPAGIISTTGVPGLTLGGGHGYLTRRYGLTIDNLVSADVVLADGSLVTASEEENQDLFWGLRGGGGNFGVVTRFVFRGQPVTQVYAGPMLWEIDQAPDIMRWYAKFMPAAPEDAYGFFAFLNVPPTPHFPEDLHRRPMCGVVWCHVGSPKEAQEFMQDVVKAVPPTFQLVGSMPYAALQSMFDPLLPSGLQWYWKGDFVKKIPDDAIKAHVQYGSRLPSLLSTMHLYPIDGAAHKVGKTDTAFSYRDATYSMVIAGIDPDPRSANGLRQWATDYWKAVHPFSEPGAYINFMMEEGEERVRATYRQNYDRLVDVKTKYDPGNLFRVNQNIRPRGR